MQDFVILTIVSSYQPELKFVSFVTHITTVCYLNRTCVSSFFLTTLSYNHDSLYARSGLYLYEFTIVYCDKVKQIFR